MEMKAHASRQASSPALDRVQHAHATLIVMFPLCLVACPGCRFHLGYLLMGCYSAFCSGLLRLLF